MKEKEYFQKSIQRIVCCFLIGASLTGCGIRDSAMVIPIGEAEAEIKESEEEVADTSEQNLAQKEAISSIYVYVCGAVVNPGVVELSEGSRADDALQAAGGFAEDAQRDYVNLAAKVEDGEKLYFPSVSEATALAASEDSEQKGLVNINTADAEQLMTLPGIGASRAQDIIAYRKEHGNFQNKEDLQKVSGIKENLYEKLCDKIVVQ